MVMTEAIDGGLTRDLYAALGEELDNGAGRAPVLQTVCPLDMGRGC